MENAAGQLSKPCPLCGQRIPLGTAKCPECGGELVPGRERATADRNRPAGRYRIWMRVTAACLAGFGVLGIVGSLLGPEEVRSREAIWSGLFLILAVGAAFLRRGTNYLLLLYFIPSAAFYGYFAVAERSPPNAIVAAICVWFVFLAFFNLHAYKQSVIAGVDPRKPAASD